MLALETPRPAELPAWDSLSEDQKRIDARYMEVFAGMVAYQDEQIGRILDELDRMGLRDNTLVIFMAGDNGASGEGSPSGTLNDLGLLANRACGHSIVQSAAPRRDGSADNDCRARLGACPTRFPRSRGRRMLN